ncbi:ATP-binding protein [Streptomyces sp. NPDC002659]|uniref:ATP-binding protein n=1 Tax=Streptomyces sp. NPDC002659 TaxID=3364656 RepID=UPI00369174C2
MTLIAPSQRALSKPCADAIEPRPAAPRPQVEPDRFVATIVRPEGSASGSVDEDTAAKVGALRRVGAAKVSHWGFPSLVDSVQLLVSGLFTNALTHAAGSEVGFALAYRPGTEVRIDVRDGSAAPARKRRPGPLEEHGRGVLLIDALADAWGTSDDGTTTWCSLTLPAAGTSA